MKLTEDTEFVWSVESERPGFRHWALLLTNSVTLRKFLNTSVLGASVHVTGRLVVTGKVS